MRRRTVEKVIQILQTRYNVRFRRSRSPYKVLIGTVLSHRTKDEVTESAEERLFGQASTPRQMLRLSEKEISMLVYPVGFYRQKAKRIKKISRILLERYGGKVPMDRELLMQLPGVGGKTADCVLSFAFGKAVIPVDTHVEVVSKRLGIADQSDNPEEVREKLHKLIRPRKRKIVNSLLVEFGKEICRSNGPRCKVCPIKNFCRYYKTKRGLRKATTGYVQ